jgi:hypothetical protein
MVISFRFFMHITLRPPRPDGAGSPFCCFHNAGQTTAVLFQVVFYHIFPAISICAGMGRALFEDFMQGPHWVRR